jgi:uncharacterized membrane protein YeiB
VTPEMKQAGRCLVFQFGTSKTVIDTMQVLHEAMTVLLTECSIQYEFIGLFGMLFGIILQLRQCSV